MSRGVIPRWYRALNVMLGGFWNMLIPAEYFRGFCPFFNVTTSLISRVMPVVVHCTASVVYYCPPVLGCLQVECAAREPWVYVLR